jgi:plastocyanin
MRRRSVAVAAIATAAALGGGAAEAQHRHGGEQGEGDGASVSMLATSFAPAHADVLAGDTVTWHNASAQRHSVTAADGSWSSEQVFPRGSYSRRFDAPGPVAYYCTVHPFMRAELGVHRLLLNRPRESAAPGRAFVLAGRAALPDRTRVALEADEGGGFRPAGSAIVQGGAFRGSVTPRASAPFRAVAGGEASPPVQVTVLERRVLVARSGGGRRVIVDVRVVPASPRATVVLQLRLRERFGWWPVRRARLDGDSTARFRLRLDRRVPARVVLTQSNGATQLARSRTITVGARR